MNLRICGSFDGSDLTCAKIFALRSSSRSMSAEIFSSLMDVLSRFISEMARLPSLIILSSSGLPVLSSFFGGSGTVTSTVPHTAFMIKYTTADTMAIKMNCGTR